MRWPGHWRRTANGPPPRKILFSIVSSLLKRNFNGIDIDGQDGISSRGDAPDYRFRLLAGKNFAGGRGNITIAGEYDQSKGLLFTDRAVTNHDDRFCPNRQNLRAANGSRVRVICPNERVPSISPYGIPVVGGGDFGLDFSLSPQQSNLFFGDPTLNFGVVDPAGNQLKFAPNGSLIPIDFGNTVGPDSGFTVSRQDLFQLVSGVSSGYHLIDLTVPAGFRIYTFTFG